MQEYWINVYGTGKDKFYGIKQDNPDACVRALEILKATIKCAYRIHVKLKPKLPTQADIIQKSNDFILNRTKYKPKEPHESWKSF